MKGFTKEANQKVMAEKISRTAPAKTAIKGKDLRTKQYKSLLYGGFYNSLVSVKITGGSL